MIKLKKIIRNIFILLLIAVIGALLVNFLIVPQFRRLYRSNSELIYQLELEVLRMHTPINVLNNVSQHETISPALIDAYTQHAYRLIMHNQKVVTLSKKIDENMQPFLSFPFRSNLDLANEILFYSQSIRSLNKDLVDLLNGQTIETIDITDIRAHYESILEIVPSIQEKNTQLNNRIIGEMSLIINTIFTALILVIVSVILGLYYFYKKQFNDVKMYLSKIETHDFSYNFTKDAKHLFLEEEEILNEIQTIFDEKKFMLNLREKLMKSYLVYDLIDHFFTSLKKKMGINRVGIAFIDYDERKITAEYGVSDYEELNIEPGYSVSFDETSLIRLMKTNKSLITNDLVKALQEKSNSISLKKIVNEGIRSNLMIPLQLGDGLFGIVFLSSKERDFFNSSHIALANQLVYEIKDLLNRSFFTKVIFTKMMKSFSEMVDRNESGEKSHLSKIAAYSVVIASGLEKSQIPGYKLSKKDVLEIERNVPAHDIGKVGLPDKILTKPGKLTEEEMALVKLHTNVGADIFKSIREDLKMFDTDFFKMAEEIVRHHHERWDGSGYPYGLRETEIPLVARIVAIADVFDTLTTEKAYKKAYTFEASVDMINQASGSHFDPVLVNIFNAHIRKIHSIYSQDN